MLSYLWNFFIIFFPQPHSFGYVAFLIYGEIYDDEMRNYEHLEDIYEYSECYRSTDDLDK